MPTDRQVPTLGNLEQLPFKVRQSGDYSNLSGATSARVASARARQLSARASAHHGDGLKPTAPQEPQSKKPPTSHRRIVDVAGSKSHSNQSLVPQPPSGTQGTSKLYSSFLQKQSAYEQHVQQQHKEAQANDLPDRTKQEPSAPLTARAEGGGVGTSKRIKTWNNEGFAAPVPLSARNSHLH